MTLELPFTIVINQMIVIQATEALNKCIWQIYGITSMYVSMEQRTKKCKQLLEYQHLLLLRDNWWSKF